MTVQSDYTPDEQNLLLRSPEAAAVAVSAASPGSDKETAVERDAAAGFVLESRQLLEPNPLVTWVQLELARRSQAGDTFPGYLEAAAAPGARETSLQTLRELAALLAAKAPAREAAGFKQFVLRTAERTSAAGKEKGGIMGIGSKMVNEHEQVILAEIAEILRVEI